MEIRTLEYFLAVAREENITRAAQQLHLTQPTLSRQLQQLEAELDVKLFQRGQYKIILTEEGMLLKQRAQELVELAEKTKRDLRTSDQVSGTIAIGSGETRSVSCLAQIMTQFQKRYPQVRYQIYSANADSIKDQLEKGILDLGLLSDPVDISKFEFFRLWKKEEWGVLVPQDDPLAQQEAVSPEDLRGRALMIGSRDLVQHELAGWFGADYDELKIVATYNLLYNVAMLVKAGLGAALCLRLESEYPGLRFVPLHPRLETGTVLVWKKNRVQSGAALKLIQMIKNTENE